MRITLVAIAFFAGMLGFQNSGFANSTVMFPPKQLDEATDCPAGQEALVSYNNGRPVTHCLSALEVMTLALQNCAAGETLLKQADGSIACQAPGGLGVGQSWVNVTGSRYLNVAYTNDTGKPIMISATAGGPVFSYLHIYINGALMVYDEGAEGGTATLVTAVIPPGDTYELRQTLGRPVVEGNTNFVTSPNTTALWTELR